MKILVIAGACLSVNSSANLCHLSYINGLLASGHEVDLIAVSNKDQNIDESIQIPSGIQTYFYDGSMYARLGALKSRTTNAQSSGKINKPKSSLKGFILSILKWFIRKYNGVYGTDRGWFNKAKHFTQKEKYDVVISLSYPPVSHRLAEYLIQRKRIKTDKWIQVWEDPWYTDIFGYSHTPQIRKEEQRLLRSAQYVCYVSPLTLMYQQKAFKDCSSKMYWQPLPSYYKHELVPLSFEKFTFGYFGDYLSHVRNLRPFCEVAKRMGLQVTICGKSDISLETTSTFQVLPRMPIYELKKYEDETNVLIFICNIKGGQIPGKIYQYAATNKLILFILDGTDEEKTVLKNYFGQFKRFIFCDNTCDDIEKTINNISQYTNEKSYIAPIDCFAPEHIISKIINIEE